MNKGLRSQIIAQQALYIVFLLGFTHCKNSQETPALFQPKIGAETGIAFKNTFQDDARHNMIDYAYCYNGGGVGAADLDNDGLPDLVFTGNQISCALYKNKGQWRFEDRTTEAGMTTTGWCTGLTFADVNADGWLDVYICRAGNLEPENRSNLLYINQQNFTFQEMGRTYGLADTSCSTQAVFFDYDRDGLLDCYVTNHPNNDRYPNRVKENRTVNLNNPATDRLYRQTRRNGQIWFEDVSKKAGIVDDGWGLGVGVGDFNRDGWPDLYVSNDFMANDLLWMNQGNGTFKNTLAQSTDYTSHSSMGNDVADMDNDGLEDVIVADMLPSTNRQRKKMAGFLTNEAFNYMLEKGYTPQYMRNTLQRNQTTPGAQVPRFQEIGQMAGFSATDWSWSPFWADFDLDGQLDLMMSSGYRHDITDMDFIAQNSALGSRFGLTEADRQIRDRARQQPGDPAPVRFFQQTGEGQFNNATTLWSTAPAAFYHGAVAADLDADGDLDVVANQLDAPALLLENTGKNTNWLNVNLTPADNVPPNGIGAVVKVFTGGQMQQRRISCTRGYQSATGPLACFGLGGQKNADSVVVEWPNGQQQTIKNISTNQVLTLKYQPDRLVTYTGKSSALKPPTTFHLFDWSAVTPYREFANEPLLPRTEAHEKCPVATADIDADGQPDYFVGGPDDYSGRLVLSRPGKPEVRLLHPEGGTPTNAYSAAASDQGAAFFDADGDGDPDLYVASGGAQFEEGSIFLQDRLYLNDGKGYFSPAPEGTLPKEGMPGSCVVTADMDLDGDTDVFVGGRRQPFQYGAPGRSMLLRNDGKGHFEDVTETLAPELRDIGMVTCAQWTDLDKDKRPDLVVAGELMPIVVCKNTQKGFTIEKLPNTGGFWQCLTLGDLNNDGQEDLMAGNIGLNQPFDLAPDRPFRVYATDLDANKHIEPICSYHIDGQEATLHGRDDILKIIPPLRKQFKTYSDFAQAKFSALFPEKSQKFVAEATEARSIWLENRNGQLIAHPLPASLQTMPIGDIVPRPDGYLCFGRDQHWDTRVGRICASAVWLLSADGKNATLQTPKGAARMVRHVYSKGGAFVLLADGGCFIEK